MKKVLFLLLLTISITSVSAQRGFNYYKDSSRVGSPNGKAYTYFKKAYYDCIWKWSKAGADSAEYYLKLAIKEDSNYSAAYAFLAHVYQFETYDRTDRDKKLALVKKYAEKALSFNPVTGDGYSAMSVVKWYVDKDTIQAFALLRKAITQEPDNVGNLIWIAIRFRHLGTASANDSGIYYMHRIIQLDSEYGQAYMKLGNVYQFDKPINDSAKFYYHKTIELYNNVKPQDRRLMDAYYWLGELFLSENKYDSAIYYYKTFLKEIEPSDMYIREFRLSSTYKHLYQCYQNLSGNYLDKLVTHDKLRIASDSTDADYLLGMLEENYMDIEKDSVLQQFAIPFAKRIQKIPSSDSNIQIFATLDEVVFLQRLKKNQQALELLQTLYSKEPKNPAVLLELGREYILEGKNKQGLVYLNEAEMCLNDIMNKRDFLELLKNPDFDSVRQTVEFKKFSN